MTIERSVVQSTMPDGQGMRGDGIAIQNNLKTEARANVTVRACVVDQSRQTGILVVAPT